MSDLTIVIGIQRTGQGHTGRTLEVIRHARNHGDVRIVTSGTQSELDLPQPPDLDLRGLSFQFGTRGGIDKLRSLGRINPASCSRLVANVLTKPLPGNGRKIVISDFEPYTAWRAAIEGLPSAQLSHQAAFLSAKSPRPKRRYGSIESFMKWFAHCDEYVGIHYQAYDNFIRTPIIRREIRDSEIRDDGHYTVYMPAYCDRYLTRFLKQLSHVRWQIFTRHHRDTYEDENVSVQPIDNAAFVASLTSCSGLLTQAGVQSTSEALFLGKKLLTVPMWDQYEQVCNSAALDAFDVPSVRRLNATTLPIVREWVDHGRCREPIAWPDHTAQTVSELIGKLVKSMDAGKPSRA